MLMMNLEQYRVGRKSADAIFHNKSSSNKYIQYENNIYDVTLFILWPTM